MCCTIIKDIQTLWRTNTNRKIAVRRAVTSNDVNTFWFSLQPLTAFSLSDYVNPYF